MTRHAAAHCALWLTVSLIVAGCGALDPYPTEPRAAPSGPPAAAVSPRVAICYNTLATTLPEVRAQAQQECGAAMSAEPVDTDWYLQNCPLLLPARATFTCLPRK